MNDIRIIDLPKILDPRGNLTFAQFPGQVPFAIERIFWTYDVPGGEQRGGHAYLRQEEVIMALSGSFDVIVTEEDGSVRKFSLNRSYYGLYLPPFTWRHMENFSTNSLALHLASTTFDRLDYVYDFEQFRQIKDKRSL
jgi:oxalate decarboxylase/phosphoglucose isomerase-like protein (cupin superfamily)